MTEVHRHSSQEEQKATYRGATYAVPFTPRVCLELNVPDPALDIVIECIVNAAHTGSPGDGKIFVTELADVVEIKLDKSAHAAPERPTKSRRLASSVDDTSPNIW